MTEEAAYWLDEAATLKHFDFFVRGRCRCAVYFLAFQRFKGSVWDGDGTLGGTFGLAWFGRKRGYGVCNIYTVMFSIEDFLLAAQPPVVGFLCMLDRIEPCSWFLLRP